MGKCVSKVSINVDSIGEASLYLTRTYGAQLTKLERLVDEDVLVGLVKLNNLEIELVQSTNNCSNVSNIFGEDLSDLYSTNLKKISS
ncbi:MAG: hypothetical protein K0S34_1611 [Bacillales bacterium]|jgi:hypothetical protein|nr:hypothetical protein [Bacillales bacterium]